MTVQSISDPLAVDVTVPPAPAAPSNLTATLGNSVHLAWTDNATNESGFTIERAVVTNGVTGTFAAIDGVGTDVTTYIDTSDVAGTTYAYRVYAFNAGGNSQPSNEVTIAVPLPGPVAPSNLAATLLTGPTRIQLTWTDNSNNENLFRVYRSVNGGAFTNYATVTRTATQRTATGGNVTYTNFAVTAGNTYAYYVIAVNTVPNPDQASAPSNTVSVAVVVPVAPSNLTGVAQRIPGNNVNDVATLNWVDNSINETGFRVQCSLQANFTNPMNFTAPANATSYSQNVSRAFNYYCRVRAFNAVGNSPWSNTVFIVTP
jgi:hypothetical protein